MGLDNTMPPPTAMDMSSLIKATGKPVVTGYIRHEHPDHWGGASTIAGVSFATRPEVRAAIAEVARAGQYQIRPKCSAVRTLQWAQPSSLASRVSSVITKTQKLRMSLLLSSQTNASPSCKKSLSTMGSSSLREWTGRIGSRRWRSCATILPSMLCLLATASRSCAASWIQQSHI